MPLKMSNFDEATPSFNFTATQDWFSFNIETWRSLFKFVQSPNPRVLEIGSWEGRSAVFLLTELCAGGGEIVCADHFDLMKTTAGRERYQKVVHNLSLTGKPFRILDEFSVPALMTLLREEMSSTNPGYDWIYVDGSHEADDTFLDGELVWRLAKQGAVIVFDDYHWDKEPENSIHHPKRGIDAFLTLHAGEFELLSSPLQYQLVLQKTSEMRIGFLSKENIDHGLENVLGYSIHIALTVDSAYAMAAAVVIRSTIVHTTGRLTFYVVDLGLTDEDRGRLEGFSENRDVTIVFISLPTNSITAKHGATFAKIDMIPILPVERVLYLDADVLVRANLQPLWATDLKRNSIAAVTDIGFPMGHEGLQRGSYFNAGVILMNLTKIRHRFNVLKATAEEMMQSKFRDQDALNRHFMNDWLPLSLKWNAQGLGTYASLPSPDRASMDISPMQDPSIVHFTGPVSPALEHVLNPYVQPYTAKPWGYAGAPGNPYKEEWWKLVDQTEWSGWRTSEAYCKANALAKDKAIREAVERFQQKIIESHITL
ncbi:uncharacterized protein FIBRA_06121 [Fibroporia radiculosa]|uniref:Glycosyltransferase family 8 protein n=1 Tax=Fibroporia radiculosa TaxID=599839 RepID=J4GS78_9APHY|nr:uncharacterized protein FIBRA_06121 [Fibroporia radiculosa]CCM03965.1 predicted protein [Fibroporia radiculosa]